MARNRPLPEVMEDILIQEGAALEKKEDGSLEFLIPLSLSSILDIPEQGVLTFSQHSSIEGAIAASYESDVFKTISRVFSAKGKWTGTSYPPALPNIDKVSKWVSEKVLLSNATFRLQQVKHETVTYILVFFKYAALSDEKREGIFSLLVNARNFSTALPEEDSMALLTALTERELTSTGTSPETLKALKAGISSASFVVQENFAPFVKSVERRLHRDSTRIFEYYETLKLETQRAFERKSLSGKVSAEEKTPLEEAKRNLSEKIEAIEGEKRWKIQDLVSKYALEVRMEPICAIDVETQTPVFWIDIKRRLLSRSFPLTYNPFFKKIDALPCEACFYPRGGYFVCDEKLHILCASCFTKCPECGRQYCPLCYPRGCPRCQKRKA